MTGGTEAVAIFDSFYIKNQQKLRADAVKICGALDSEDELQDTYIKIRTRIEASGFTTSKYDNLERALYAFFWRSLYNLDRRNKRLDKFLTSLDIQDKDVAHYCEQVIAREKDDFDWQGYYDRVETKTKLLFKFVSLRHSDKKNYLWKCYYLKPETRSYDKLSKQTGFSRKYVMEVIQTIKKDIRENFDKWAEEFIKSGKRV